MIGHRDLCEPAWHTRRGSKTPSRARTTQHNTTYKHLRNKNPFPHALCSHMSCSHRDSLCIASFAFQMFAHSSNCKCALLLFTLHTIAYCIHITDVCVIRAHACIVFALWVSGFQSPCGGSTYACTHSICGAGPYLAHLLDLHARCLHLITRIDITLSHALILLSYMHCEYIITCTAITSSHVLLLIHHIYYYYFITCSAIT